MPAAGQNRQQAMQGPDDMVGRGRRRRRRRALLGGVAVLYVVSIPWYRTPTAPPHVLLGLPDWVLVALGCYLGAALMTAAAWLLADIRDADEDERPAARRR